MRRGTRFALLFPLLTALAVIAFACDGDDGGGPAPSPAATASPTPGLTPTVSSVCLPNPGPATADQTQVDTPSAGTAVTSPVRIVGRIAVFEAQFNITVYDADGNVIADVAARSEEGQVLSPFSEDVPFTVTEDTPACIWVYDASPQDGSPVQVVQVPVTLKPGGEPQVCQPNPDPATPEFQVIDQPSPGDVVSSPVTVSGQVIAFEGTYQVGIFDAAGDPIVETFGTAEGEIGELAPFSIDVEFEVDEPTPACVWVYEASARDGQPVHVGQIAVTLEP